MTHDPQILIEKFLAGEISAEEGAELAAYAETDPDIAEQLESLRRDDELLRQETRAQTARVNWRRFGRVRFGINIVNWLYFAFVLCLTIAFTYEVASNFSWSVKMVFRAVMGPIVLFTRLTDAWIDARRSERLFQKIEDGQGDYLARYRSVLKGEIYRLGSATGIVGFGVIVFLILAAVGNHPEVCLSIAALIAAFRTFKYFTVVRPMKRELAELEG